VNLEEIPNTIWALLALGVAYFCLALLCMIRAERNLMGAPPLTVLVVAAMLHPIATFRHFRRH
jgi:hypothetical protein